MRITAVQSTDLFTGTAASPLQVIRVTVQGSEGTSGPARPEVTGEAGPVRVRVEGPGVSTPVAFCMDMPGAGRERTAEVGVQLAAPSSAGSSRQVTAIAQSGTARAQAAGQITAAEPGWTMWMVSHFHYDPVWWDTQGEFTQSRLLLPDENGQLPEARTAFELVALHLDTARRDSDYKFVLAEIDYLKPYLDTHPQDRADLRQLLAEGRIEIVGGNYNEPNTNLTSAESTIRNAIYGIGYQRDVAGGDPATAWMLDVFGHDPGYPGLMAAAGLAESSWARGPYHQWGPERTVGSNERMQLRNEFQWISPDGRGLLTSYMPNHYGAGWGTHRAAGLTAAEQDALAQFRSLAAVAATRNVLLPVGADHVIPSRWVTAIHRDWNARYLWPRFVTALPREFFAAVRADAAQRDIWLLPQTRDMNPVYPGKDVSYIDTKQAQRAAETALAGGERLATLAWLAGAPYPLASLDKAWRLLAFGAHHDAITGTESDQVYLDLLGGWREAWTRGDEARRAATGYLAGLADTSAGRGALCAITVFSTLSWARPGMASATVEFAAPGPSWVSLSDGQAAVPFLAEGVRRHPDGTLAGAVLTFRAAQVPALGYRTYWVRPAAGPDAGGWEPQPGTAIENEAFRVEADPARGGTLRQITDKRTGTALLRPGPGGGNELLVQEEYDYHPRWGEGPWLLSPKGPGTGSGAVAAKVTAQRCAAGARLLAEFPLGGLRVVQETLLWDGADRVEFRTHVDGSIGQDRLLRVRFPAGVPGGLPIYQCATAVIGRPFGAVGADAAEHPFTLDNPAHEWFGLGSTARVEEVTAGGGRVAHAIGVAEIILPSPAAAAAGALRESITGLAAALAGQGVTATCSWPDGPRYGSLDLDSNVPDVRIALGGPRHNPWVADLVAALPAVGEALAAQLAGGPAARVWVPAGQSRAAAFGPSADVRGQRDLPVLIVAGAEDGEGAGLAAALDAVRADLAGSVIGVPAAGLAPGLAPELAAALAGGGAEPALAGHCVALLNKGTPGSLVTPDGTLYIALMRSCSAWPSGVWIDGDKRTAPDGSSFAWQHWSHTFEYALAAGAGDWRDAGFGVAGQDYNHGLLACVTGLHPGPLPASASLASATGPAMITTLKPSGNALAHGGPVSEPVHSAGVTARLRDLGAREPVRTEVRLAGGIGAAAEVGLLEEGAGAPVPVSGGTAAARIGPGQTVTLALSPGAAADLGPAGAGPAGAGGTAGEPAAGEPAAGGSPMAGTGTAVRPCPEPAQPVFTRYWLHGKGPAPAGNLPVAVHLSPGRVSVPAGGVAALRLSVAGGPQPASGMAELSVPDGLIVSPAGPLAYDLGPGGHVHWDLAVRGRPGAGPGRYFLTAQASDPYGQLLEDATAVLLGEPPQPDLSLPLDDLLPLLEADQQALAAEMAVTVLTPELAVRPGESGEVVLRLANQAASEVRGEAQLISPFGSWESAHPWTRGFTVPAGNEITLRYHIQVPMTSRSGMHWWVMVKIMYFGRLRYTSSIPITISE